MSNRKKATELILKSINDFSPGNPNVEMYRKLIDEMSDKEFEAWMTRLKNKEETLFYFEEPWVKPTVQVEDILKVADSLSITFFERIYYIDPITKSRVLTPFKCFIIRLPVRRLSQFVTRGKSVSNKSNNAIDNATGQVTKSGYTARLSVPEFMILQSAGQYKAIEEFTNIRGGNIKGFQMLKHQMLTQGVFNLDSARALNTRPESIDTLRSFLFGMHYENNL